MPKGAVVIDHKAQLNRASPVFARAKIGDVLYDMIEKYNALLAKLDGDAGVSATDHVATLTVKKPEDR